MNLIIMEVKSKNKKKAFMANILQSRFSNIMVSCLTTVAFTTATLIPHPLMATGVNLDLRAINFGIKMENMI